MICQLPAATAVKCSFRNIRVQSVAKEMPGNIKVAYTIDIVAIFYVKCPLGKVRNESFCFQILKHWFDCKIKVLVLGVYCTINFKQM